MFITSKSIKVILLDKKLKIQKEEAQEYAVILSPTLYWVKKFSIPVRSSKEAQKLLPSLFEEFLPEGKYEYFGYFQEDSFFGFAYDKEMVVSLLKQKGIELSQVVSVRFAQSEFTEKDLPYALDEDRVLVLQEGIVIVMPGFFVNEKKKINLQQLQLSNHTLKKFERYDHLINTKTVLMIALSAVGVLLFNIMAWYETSQTNKEIQMQQAEVFKKYHLLPTKMQNLSLLKKYEKIYQNQKEIRKIFHILFSLNLPKNVLVESITYEKKIMHIVFLHVKQPEEISKQFSSLQIVKKQYKKDQLRLDIAV